MYRCEHYIPDRGFQLEMYHKHGQEPYIICKICQSVFTTFQAQEIIDGVMSRMRK